MGKQSTLVRYGVKISAYDKIKDMTESEFKDYCRKKIEKYVTVCATQTKKFRWYEA